jgi:hypothetical protein
MSTKTGLDKMAAYCQEVRKLEDKFEGLEYGHILRDKNEAADELAKMGSSRAVVPPGIFMQQLHEPSLPRPKQIPPAPSGALEESQPDPSAVMAVDSDWNALHRVPTISEATRGLG